MSTPQIATRRLPSQPNLEQVRKQAKDLLRDYLADEPSAADEVNRFESKPTAEFSLSDAQRVLAHAYGFPSWPKLKAFIDGVTVTRFVAAAREGDVAQVRSMLASRPELACLDAAESDERRAIHFAVLRRDPALVQLLMEAGADARKGVFPHRDATSAFALAQERGFTDIVTIIEEEERRRREEMSCSNATVSAAQDQISLAISSGDRATAMRMLGQDLSMLHACDRQGRTPLHLAAEGDDAELVEWLLKKRANVQKKDPHDFTPLDYAASATDRKQFSVIAQLLLDRGAALTIRAAVALGDEDQVRALLAADRNLLQRAGLLTIAVNHGQVEMARLLLDLGADVDERNLLQNVEEPTESWGMPLWRAATRNDLAITRLLLDRGADPNANVYASGWPLRNAWNHEDDSVKRLLLERGARPQPYMLAEAHDIASAKALLAENPNEELASELAWSAADHGCPEIVEMALGYLSWAPADPRWHWIMIQPIRGAGADSLQNEGHFRSMAALLRHGVNPDVSRLGQTVLHFAAARRGDPSGKDRARFASMLIDAGAGLNTRDDLLQSTPLGWACRWGQVELAMLFIERGAAVLEPDAEPWATPLAWAKKMHHTALIALLEVVASRSAG